LLSEFFGGKNNQIKTFEIIRDEIVMPSVDLEIKTTFNGKKVALLTIYHFSENTVQAFKSTINEMLAQNISGIVLDCGIIPEDY
jgi:C-terminal processing protease CtpA/Prc